MAAKAREFKNKGIDVIALMNADYLKAKLKNRKKLART